VINAEVLGGNSWYFVLYCMIYIRPILDLLTVFHFSLYLERRRLNLVLV